MIIKFFTGKWSPYLSGIVIAVLFITGLYLLDTPMGMSDAYLMISNYCEKSIRDRAVDKFPIDWDTGFLAGIFIGALISSFAGGNWKLSIFPEDRASKGFLASTGLTPLQGLVGGFLVMLGLQLAGDSFLGQWAAAIQLSTGAWIFLFSIIVWGVIFTGIISAKATNKTGTAPSKKKAEKE